MMECCHQIEELEISVKALNDKARQINRNLFIFDEFRLKGIPDSANDEVVFWYLIINLYGIFFDAGKYIRDLNDWDYSSGNKVKAFYDALNEVRSVFCHNKTNASYLPGIITNKRLDKLVPDWAQKTEDGIKHLIDQKFVSQSPFKDLYDLFFLATNQIFDLIDTRILDSFAKYTEPDADMNIYNNWFIPIFNWYCETPVVYTRAYKTFCCKNAQRLKDQGNIYDTDEATIENFVSKRKKDLNGIVGNLNSHYAANIYKARFSLKVSVAQRMKFTPCNVLLPLLENKLFNIPLGDMF